MNRDKMIEAMAVKMSAGYILEKSWLEMAKAVLDLCGPDPLVWEKERGDNYVIYRAVCPATKLKYVAGTDRNGDSYWGCDNLNRHQEIDSGGWEAAQAAAQSHATAAHWANTPLGKLVGVV